MGDVIKPHMLCHACGVAKIGYLQIIWCNDCATKKENPNG